MKRWLHVPVKGGTVTFEVEVTDGVSLHSLRDAFVTVFASDATYAQASGDSELQRRHAALLDDYRVLETKLAHAEQERVTVATQLIETLQAHEIDKRRWKSSGSVENELRVTQAAAKAADVLAIVEGQRDALKASLDTARAYQDGREKEYNQIYQNQRMQIQVLTGRLELAGIRADEHNAATRARADLAKTQAELASLRKSFNELHRRIQRTEGDAKRSFSHEGCRKELERVREGRNTDLRRENDRLRQQVTVLQNDIVVIKRAAGLR